MGSMPDAAFQGLIENMGGIEIDFIGNPFMWDDVRRDLDLVCGRLNRAICSEA